MGCIDNDLVFSNRLIYNARSDFVDCIIENIAYTSEPSELKFMIADNTCDEYKKYESAPYFLIPVIKSESKVLVSLNWVEQEINYRIDCFEKIGVSNFKQFNNKADEKMPRIIIIINDIADYIKFYKSETMQDDDGNEIPYDKDWLEFKASLSNISANGAKYGIHIFSATKFDIKDLDFVELNSFFQPTNSLDFKTMVEDYKESAILNGYVDEKSIESHKLLKAEEVVEHQYEIEEASESDIENNSIQVNSEIEEKLNDQLEFIELVNNFYEDNVEIISPSIEEVSRYNKLCDDEGFNYDEIKKFEYWLNTPTCEQWIHYFEINSKYNSLIKTPELDKLYLDKASKLKEYELIQDKLEELFQQDDEKEVMLKVANEKAMEEFEKGNVENVTKIMNYVKEKNSDDYISVTGISNYGGGTVEEISELLPKIASKTKQLLRTALLLISIGILGLCTGDEGITYVAVFVFIIGLYNLFKSIALKTNKQIIQKAFDKHQEVATAKKDERDVIINNEKKLKKELNEIEQQIIKLEEYQIKKLSNNEEFVFLKEERDAYEEFLTKGGMTINQLEFFKFRLKHFNDEAERLLRKLNIKRCTKVLREKAVGQGSEEDYRRFIEDKVLGINELYFEDYREYYKMEFLNNNS